MDILFRKAIPQDFWHGKKIVGKNFTPGNLGGYYNDLTHKTIYYKGNKSPEGIPLVKLEGNLGYILHPVTVCQVGLGWYERWLFEKQEQFLDNFFLLANWLVSHQEKRTEIGGVWPIPYPVEIYGLKAGWISALVQGQAISVLARAYKETKKEQYLSAVISAVKPFLIGLESGGVLSKWKDNDVFFEEYPCLSISKVLNGFISSLWGLYDYLLLEDNVEVRNLYNSGMDSLLNHLSLYDTGFWSRYSQISQMGISNLASPYYHKEHIEQLKACYLLTNNQVFMHFAYRWEKYSTNNIITAYVITIKIFSKFNSLFSRRKFYI